MNKSHGALLVNFGGAFDNHRRIGIAGNMDFLLIGSHEENEKNPELVIYKKR